MLILEDEMKDVAEPYITTDDGSYGFMFATDKINDPIEIKVKIRSC